MIRITTDFAIKLIAQCHSRRHYWQVLGKFDTQDVDRMIVLAAVQAEWPLFTAPYRGA